VLGKNEKKGVKELEPEGNEKNDFNGILFCERKGEDNVK
jgi:hypothetical protein